MAQERTSMRKIKEVLRLHFEARISQAKISSVAKISRYTVQQYIMRFMAAGLSWPLDLRDNAGRYYGSPRRRQLFKISPKAD
jgi:hypothetical protein